MIAPVKLIAATPPRSTPEKMRQASLARSRTLLENGIPQGLSDTERRFVEVEYQIAQWRRQQGLL